MALSTFTQQQQNKSAKENRTAAEWDPSSSTLVGSGKAGVFTVVGAGLAGIATAIGLRQNGHRVTVCESRADVKEIGAAVECGPNGTRILSYLGLDIENLGGVTCTGVNEFNFRGMPTLQRDFKSSEVDNWPVLLIHRRDLLAELLRVAQDPSRPGPPVEIRNSSKVVSIDCGRGIVELSNGQQIGADVVIGADGVHSALRSAVIGYESPGVYSGEATYRALVETKTAFKDPEIKACIDMNRFTMFIARDRRVIVFPCANGTLLNVMCIVPDDPDMRGDEIESWAEMDVIDDLVEDFQGFPEHVQRLLSLCVSCGRWKLYDHKPLPNWVKGRTILIGDAAHPMLPTQGQGLCQSLEDAEAMSTMFSDPINDFSLSEVQRRLEKVYKCRYERATRIQALSRSQAAGPRRAGQAQESHEFSWFNWATIASVDWLERIDNRQEKLSLPEMVPRKINQLIPETDLLDTKQGGRVSSNRATALHSPAELDGPDCRRSEVDAHKTGGFCGLFAKKRQRS